MPRRGKLWSMSEPEPSAGVAAAEDPACAVAHGHAEAPADAIAHGHTEAPVTDRTMIAIFNSPVARFLLGYARDAGYHPVLVDPAAEPAPAGEGGYTTARSLAGLADDRTDVVVTDHHRPELGEVVRDALASPARWVGVMGNPRHPAPHIPALAALGVPDGEIARVHRPIGLNIGSRTPAEIALATVAGLIADRNGRPGGFEF
jgi:xanthine dehydrogenase accessory factor